MAFERVPLGEVLSLRRGYDLPARVRRDGAVPVVSSQGISGRHDVARVCAPGVVTGRTGTLGGVFFLDEDFWPLNTTLFVEDFKGNDPRFVAHLLSTIDFEAFNDKAAIPGVSRHHLHALELARPRPAIQRAVADILARLDRRRRLLAAMDERARAMAETLFAMLPPGRPRRVEELCGRIGNGATPPRRDRALWDGDVSWFRSGELRDGPLVYAGETITRPALTRSACRLFPRGSVLVAMYASPTVGRLGMLAGPAAVNQACCALVARPEIGGHLLFHALLATRDRLARQAVGAAQQNISQGIVRAHEVEVPDDAAGFEARAARLFRLRVAYAREIRALDRYEAALLPELVTGRIAVEA